MRFADLIASYIAFFIPGLIGGGVAQHSHASATSGGNTLQHIPPGAIVPFAFGSDPTGFLECNGQNVSRTTYADLFAAIGTTWGIGDGATTFTLPDLRRRALRGKNGAGTGTLGNAVGNVGGAETHTLAAGEMPVHAHTVNRTFWGNVGAGGAVIVSVGGDTASGNSAVLNDTVSNAGSGSAHNILAPAAIVGYYIKY